MRPSLCKVPLVGCGPSAKGVVEIRRAPCEKPCVRYSKNSFDVLWAVLNLLAHDFRQVCGDIMHAPWLGARDVVEPVGVLHRAHEEAQSTVFALIASRTKLPLQLPIGD